MKVIVVRDGSAILFAEFGQKPVKIGDVILLGANVLCGSEPAGHITVTTVYLDVLTTEIEYARRVYWT